MALGNETGSRSRRSGVVLVVLLALSLASVTLHAREGDDGAVHALQRTFSGLISPVKSASGGVSAAEQGIGDRIADAQADPNSLTELRAQNEQLRSTIATLEEYRQEALRLEGLLQMRSTYGAEGVPARVLSHSTDAWNQVVTIDAGSNDGIHAGLPVLGPSGLIGQVASTTETTAEVRLLTDSASGVAVLIQSNREEGIVHGSLEGLLYLEDISDDVEVLPGDVLLTSGLGGGYFRGIMVGTVLKVEGEAGATMRKIVVDPNEMMVPLEEVYVITSMTTSLAPEEEDDENAEGADGADAGYTGYGYGYDDAGYGTDEGTWY